MKRLLTLPLLLLAACEPPAAGEPEPPRAPAASPTVADIRPSYVGRWAVSPELCAAGAFVLKEGELVTAGEVAGQWQEETFEAGVWRMAARCTAEAPPQPARLQISVEGDGLRIEGAPFEPVTLRRCPPA